MLLVKLPTSLVNQIGRESPLLQHAVKSRGLLSHILSMKLDFLGDLLQAPRPLLLGHVQIHGVYIIVAN